MFAAHKETEHNEQEQATLETKAAIIAAESQSLRKSRKVIT